MAKGIIDSEGRKIEFEPPAPTSDKRGGIIAKARTNEDIEVVVDQKSGKAYVGVEVGVIYDENTHSLTFGNVNENLLLLSETLSQVVEV